MSGRAFTEAGSAQAATLSLRRVTKHYEGDVVAVDDVSLAIGEGELLALVGPSGCGKTTTCKMIAGLEGITSGDLFIGGRRVNDLAPEQRNIAMVFEDYALYPRMNVYENVAFPLRVRNRPRAEIQQKVSEMLEKIELTEVARARVQDLSGGQQQRVSIARALVRQPTVLIMDEPLSHLDVSLKGRLRTEIRVLQQQLGLTGVLVTHDQAEAMAMADRIAVMHLGELRQCASPHEIYDHPVDTFVAGFIGEPPMNFLRGRLTLGDGGAARFAAPALDLEVGGEIAARLRSAGLAPDRQHDVIAGIRPEHISVVAQGAAGHAAADVYFKEWIGDVQSLMLTQPDGDDPWLILLAEPQDRYEIGARVRIAVDTSRVCFFDVETERNLLAASTPAQDQPAVVA